MNISPPIALIAELTHRCPLQCPYCSNPLDLLGLARERDTAFWINVIDEAAELGVLQLHLTGGEPCLRADLAVLVAHAAARGIYVNLITSAVVLDEAKLRALAEAGLGHVQISIQGAQADAADRIGHYRGGHEKKLGLARLVPGLGMSLTINAVVHRQNLDELPAIIALAASMGADRLEVAHVQYHGWALRNRDALMPDRAAFEAADRVVAEQRTALRGQMVIDYVVPDYYAQKPKTCMGGWGQRVMTMAPDGSVLPCHAAQSIPGLVFERAGERPLRAIWEEGAAFTAFRGTGWMREPCASCPAREQDWGGCRCQAMALTGDAANTDPVCHLSPLHERVTETAMVAAQSGVTDFIYRRL
ncbi:MAG: pyrroloquinoline quinone biosynthesis protein PqqE [Acidocella sp.]|nr:pyrroloquinoline quinone biosynthesis protein PqqE [Acidocella sp.]